MSDFKTIQAASALAQNRTAAAMGSAADKVNFIGPAAERKTAVFRPASTIEQLNSDADMTAHGFRDRTVQVALVTADQFNGNPDLARAWRSKNVVQLSPVYQEGFVSQVNVEDPFFYSFVLLCRPFPRNG